MPPATSKITANLPVSTNLLCLMPELIIDSSYEVEKSGGRLVPQTMVASGDSGKDGFDSRDLAKID
jgi:hypothetical protein